MAFNNCVIPSSGQLIDIFQRFDTDNSNTISAEELQEALSTGAWNASFNYETIRLMIAMFDDDNSGKINFQEFQNLWTFIIKWEDCFRSFDNDNSGSIDFDELKTALKYLGLNPNNELVNKIIGKYSQNGSIQFDNFIYCCVKLINLTRAFRAYDKDSDGWVDIHYNQFLGMMFQ